MAYIGAKRALLGGKSRYYQKVKSLFGSNIIGYWPLDETVGVVVKDRSGHGRNGVYSGGVILNSVASPVEGFAPALGGVDNVITVYSASLAGVFSGAEGSMFVWVKIDASLWTDDAYHYIFDFRVDDSNLIRVNKSNGNDIIMQYIAGGTQEVRTIAGGATDWIHLGVTWSKSNDRVRLYFNGWLPFIDSVTLGVFSGTIPSDLARLGCYYNDNFPLLGSLSHAILLNREATPAEALSLSRMSKTEFVRISVLGDSIEFGASDWVNYVGWAHNNGATWMANHAVAGDSIMSDMDDQVIASVNDDSDIIIIALGTNDDDAGDMGALQTEVEENIIELKASNPSAVIYYMNVLPRWEDEGEGAEVEKGNIRTAVAAACTAQSITCWDTYTAPWIAQGETIDGLHPDAVGVAAIVVEVLSRL